MLLTRAQVQPDPSGRGQPRRESRVTRLTARPWLSIGRYQCLPEGSNSARNGPTGWPGWRSGQIPLQKHRVGADPYRNSSAIPPTPPFTALYRSRRPAGRGPSGAPAIRRDQSLCRSKSSGWSGRGTPRRSRVPWSTDRWWIGWMGRSSIRSTWSTSPVPTKAPGSTGSWWATGPWRPKVGPWPRRCSTTPSASRYWWPTVPVSCNRPCWPGRPPPWTTSPEAAGSPSTSSPAATRPTSTGKATSSPTMPATGEPVRSCRSCGGSGRRAHRSTTTESTSAMKAPSARSSR